MIFGMWMWPKSLREGGTKAAVTRCKRAGVTDIYFLTKGLSGTVTYKSAIAPMDCERDLLGELLVEAHKQGIRVHAWFTSASDEIYKERHPQSGRYHYIKGRDRGLISLADEGYIAYMSEVTRELCCRYPVDGLHLDYIRYNHLIYGWSEADRVRYAAEGADIAYLQTMMDRAFRQEEGAEIFFDAYRSGDRNIHALARARRKDVVRFATALTSVARTEKTDLILSAALMPEGAYQDIAFSDVHYGQNYEDAVRLYDYALPMAYSQAYHKDGDWVRDVALGAMKRGLKTIVGVHAYEGGTAETLRADIAAVRDLPVEGVCLFREGAYGMAFADGVLVDLYNPLDTTITLLKALRGNERASVECSVLPGEEKTIKLPFEAEALRAFSGEKEVCIYLSS
ncbi:MAG TPA: family 10 glycosylhydrolase [Clostridiales bacterium]|jgi:uncharacterized lipoprotein YddW (UPF0748 family)|nr:family 10 glycosylhydrolase [Clostridiales bacterium]